jgi:guanylate kinase
MADVIDHSFSFLRRGILFIISAPSGVGKTTLSRQLLSLVENLRPSISYTTRAPRAGEVDGQDYHFVNEDYFLGLRAAGAFAEWAQVHRYLYGTPRAPLDAALELGRDLLLDIDVQGARQIKASYSEAVSIFILPPSWKELERRLRARATDSEEVIYQRLQRAQEEASELFSYDYWLVNDRVEYAVTALQNIIVAERARTTRLIREHLPAPLFSAVQGKKPI